MSKPSAILLSIKERLEDLCCPYLEDGSEQWIAEILLHQSETRLKLLHWVLCTFDPGFEDLLSNKVPVMNNRLDGRYQRFLIVLNMIGHSKSDDMEIVKGTASQKKQLAFWDRLIETVYILEFGYSYSDKSVTHDKAHDLNSACARTLSEKFKDTCKFIDILVREHKTADIFSTDVRLFPANFEEIIKSESMLTVPSLDMLIESTEKLKQGLLVKASELETLMNNNENFTELDQQRVENYCRKFDLSLRTLLQMTDLFIHTYDNEIKTSCSKPTPLVSEIGANINSITSLTYHFELICKRLHLIKHSTTDITNGLMEKQKWNNDCLVKPSEIDEIRATTEILRKSLHRF